MLPVMNEVQHPERVEGVDVSLATHSSSPSTSMGEGSLMNEFPFDAVLDD